MPRLRVEFNAEWSPEKIRGISNQLRRDIYAYRGVGSISDIMVVDDKLEPPPKPALLKLYCTNNQFGKGRCTEEWESETFTPCPKHGRAWVHKGKRPKEEKPPADSEVAVSS